MQGKEICSRIQICRRTQFFSRMASADQGKLGLRPFLSSQHYLAHKALILLYKRICVKTNMKKHDEKKQGTTGSVSSKKRIET